MPESSFPNGVAAGDVDQGSAVLWARSTNQGDVTFELSVDPDFRTIAGRQTAAVTDPTLPVKVEISGLEAGTTYYYRAIDSTDAVATGVFDTPQALGERAGLTFGVSGDLRGEFAPFPALANADEAHLDFFVALGDSIYADHPSPALPKEQAETLADFRAKHAEIYSERGGIDSVADLRASTAVYATIDDHEVTDDFAGGADPASDPRFAGSTAEFINDTPLYTNGLQAFEEYNPIREETYGDTGDPVTSGEAKLYRFNIHGSDAATFVLDARSFRDENLTPPNPLDPADIARYIGETFDPTRTLLGTAQLDQLMQDLLTAQKSGTTWKFVFVPEPIQNFGPVESEDRYEGFAAERNQLLKFIADHGISNVVFVAADVHAGIVNNLTYQEFPGGPQIATTAIEITTGPVAHEPFGFDIVDLAARLGVITPEQKAFWESLPVAPDPDDVVNDKDDFVKSLVNGQLAQFGYDPIGLDNNLPQADGLVNAQLLQGDYFIAHQFCWTKFSIDPATQKLTVTTYGIPSYSAAEAQADPAAIAALQPTAVAEFTVTPVLAEAGNKTFIVNSGDQIDIPNFGVLGFRDHPSAAVLAELDTLQFIGPGLVARNMLLSQHGDDVMITFAGDSSGTRVTLQNTQVGELDNVTVRGKAVGNFIFDGQTAVVDDLDVFGSKGAPAIVRGHDRVTFLNDFDNHFHGRAGSQDVINAQGGDDTVFGAGGADLMRGGTGSDSLSGDAGNDTLAGDSGNDAVLSAGGNAVLGSDIDRVDGARLDGPVGPGADTLNGGRGEDLLLGEAGDDKLIGGGGNDSLDGGVGTDTAVFAGKAADYEIATVGDVTTVTDLRPLAKGDDGTDTLTSVEQLQFADATVRVPGRPASIDLATLTADQGFVIFGADAGDLSGRSVSSAGDVNGDGFGDVTIGALYANPSDSGAAYVIFCQADGVVSSLDLSTLDGTNGFRLDGVAPGDNAGISVSGAGDVNGDGFGDLIIGANAADPNGYDSGAAYVVFGRANGFASTIDLSGLDGTNGFQLAGAAELDEVGQSVSAAGDINGDGLDDIVVSTGHGDINATGVAYVVFGQASSFPATLDLSTLDGSDGFRLDGYAGIVGGDYSVSGVGDINGDGYDDLIVGGQLGYANAFVIFGHAGTFTSTTELSVLDGSNGFQIRGIYEAASVSAAGDVNGDGFDDIVIGAPSDPFSTGESGAAYVIFGQADGFASTLDLSTLDGANGFRLDGAAPEDLAGFSVSAAGDVNGDGFDDLIIGAPGADAAGDAKSFAGESYVIFGTDQGFGPSIDLGALTPSRGFVIYGADASDISGSSVSAAGNVNGDGFDDLIVGAPAADAAGNLKSAAGESYVIYGGPSLGGAVFAGTTIAEMSANSAIKEVSSANAGSHNEGRSLSIMDVLDGASGPHELPLDHGGDGAEIAAMSSHSDAVHSFAGSIHAIHAVVPAPSPAETEISTA